MSVIESLGDWVVGRVTFPLTNYLLNRKGILGCYEDLMKSERYPEEVLREMQLQRLKKVVQYAERWSPFYSKRFKEIGLSAGDIKSLSDLQRIPALSRQDVIEHHQEMVDVRYQSSIPVAERSTRGPGVPASFARFRRHRLVRNTSSGSTGAPTVFYEDGSQTALSWAHELRLRQWYGHSPGVREARLTRFSTDYLPNSRVVRMRKLLWHQLLLPGINLSDSDYALCFRRVKEFRPKVLWGFTAALTGLADYIRRSGEALSCWRPSLVITWAGPLYEHERKILKEVFDCSITNIYGAREVGHVAALCPRGTFHINQEYLLVERDRGEGPGSEAGELLVTTLHNSVMPFIRYRMGDLGEVAQSRCSCGRSLEVLQNFLGRTGEVFVTKEGRMISPNFWCRTFMNEQRSRAIKRFQVIYTREGNIRIRMVRNENYTSETEADLRRFLEANFGPETQIRFEYVPSIEPQVSGKYQMVIKEQNLQVGPV